MNLREISFEEFRSFTLNHPLGNFHQTLEYALLKSEEGYDYELIGYFEDSSIIAASLILYKKIGSYFYGYAPRGFIVDYANMYFLEKFTKELKEYYSKKNFAFIKINPEIAIGELNKKTKNIKYNVNYSIIDNLIKCGYKKLKNNMYFESLLPRYNAIVPLKKLNSSYITKNTRNKIRKGIRKGLTLEKGSINDIEIFYNFIKNKRDKDLNYYKDLYNTFDKNNSIDIFLVKVDFKKYLINSQNSYQNELVKNSILNDKIINKHYSSTINAKMNSDKAILSYKNDIAEASKYLNTNEELILAGALVIKFQNRITIQISGFDKNLKRYTPNYFLYYAILDYYKESYSYADLNGVTADLSKDSPFHGLNEFKLGFNPNIYEYIGEFDLPIIEYAYESLLKSKLLAKEFNK